MPPTKGGIWDHYLEMKDATGKLLKVVCRYCQTGFTFPNATRMSQHIGEKCQSCPPSVKNNFAVKPDGKTQKYSDIKRAVIVSHEVDDPAALNDDTGTSGPSSRKQQPPKEQHAPPPKKQKVVHNYFDSLHKDEKVKLDSLSARALFSKGLPLSTFEGPYMKAAFEALRPAYTLPSDKTIGGRLLNEEYKKVMATAESVISNSTCVTLTCDGWTNRKGDGLVNFVAATPEPVFLKCVEPAIDKEDSKFMFQEFVKIIEEVGACKVLLVVTDNAAVLKAVWKLLQARYPHIFFIGCGAHSLNLLFKDILKVRLFQDLLSNSKLVLKIKRKRQIYSVFKEKQKSQNCGKIAQLLTPSPTRFSGAFFMFDSLSKNKTALQETVLVENIGVPSNVRAIVLDNDFWSEIKFAVDYLKPLVDGIHYIEADNARLSQMVAVCMHVKSLLLNLDESPISLRDCDKITQCVKYRIKNFCISNIHKATYIVDPQFSGEGLSDAEYIAAMEIIRDQAIFLKLNPDNVIENLADFKTRSNFFERELMWEAAKAIGNPVTWWHTFCKNQPLFPIAIRLLVLVPTSTSCERIWSCYEHVHSKKRNRLLNKKSEKLVAVKSNLNLCKHVCKTDVTKKKKQYQYDYAPVSLDSDCETDMSDSYSDAPLWSSDSDSEDELD